MGELSFERWGDGDHALVLLHGFTGSRSAWAHLRPLWEPHCRLLVVDLPGHGSSPLEAAPTFGATLGELDRLLEREGFLGGSLLGYSLGARLALGLAVQRPYSFERLILESGSPGLRRRKARSERRRQDEELAKSIEQRGVADFIQRWEALPLFAGLRTLPEPQQADLRARRLSGSVNGFAGSLRSLGLGMQPNLWPALPALRVPTLLLTGERDAKFTAIAKEMAAELPTAWRRSFAGCGHAPHLEAPGAYAAEVLAFLQTPWMESSPMEMEHEMGSTP